MKWFILSLFTLFFSLQEIVADETHYRLQPMHCLNEHLDPGSTLDEFWLYGMGRKIPKIDLILNQPSEVHFFFRFHQKRVLQETLPFATLRIFPASQPKKWSVTLSEPKIEIIKLKDPGLPQAYYRNPQGVIESFFCQDADPGLPTGGGMSGGN